MSCWSTQFITMPETQPMNQADKAIAKFGCSSWCDFGFKIGRLGCSSVGFYSRKRFPHSNRRRCVAVVSPVVSDVRGG